MDGNKDARQPLHGGADIVIGAVYPDRMNQADWSLLFSYLIRHAGKVRVALPALMTEAGRDGAGNVLLFGGRLMSARQWTSYPTGEDYMPHFLRTCEERGFQVPTLLVKPDHLRAARELAERKVALAIREKEQDERAQALDERERLLDARIPRQGTLVRYIFVSSGPMAE